MRTIRVVCCLMLLQALCAWQGDAKASVSQAPNPDTKQAGSFDGSIGQLKALDDPDNPYLGQYAEWDLWAFENVSFISKYGDHRRNLEVPDGQAYLWATVNENGYMVPCQAYVREYEEAVRDVGDDHDYVLTPYYLTALGSDDSVPSGWAEESERLTRSIQSEFYMPIPDWLNEKLTAEAALLPNGDVITKGLLGGASGDPELNLRDFAPRDDRKELKPMYYRYSADGELISGIASSTPFDHYWDFSNPHPGGGLIDCRSDGYVIFRGLSNEEKICAVYDYDGTKLALDAEPPRRDTHHFKFLNSQLLEVYYLAQHGEL